MFYQTRLATTTPALPTYAPTNITPTNSLFSNNSLQVGASYANAISQGGSQNGASQSQLMRGLSTTASAAATGAQVGGPWGAAIAAVANILVQITSDLPLWGTDIQAGKAEDQIGAAINTLYGGTHPVVSGSWADPNLQAAIDTLTYDDFQQNPSHWALFIADEGNIATGQTSSGETSCRTSKPGMNCVLWTLLHTKPQPSTESATPKRYVAKVNEALTNLQTYMTGLGYQALSTNTAQSTVLGQVVNKGLSLSTILGNAQKATTQVAQGIGLQTSSMGTVGTILVVGAAVGMIVTLIRQKGGTKR